MEAENYLSTGYGHWLALKAILRSKDTLGEIARVWQPSRLKGITVGREHGTPFLAATQAFDLRPIPRKFLSLDRTENSEERFTKEGTILVTCSGTVGRATLATSALNGVLISHDLLRVEPREEALWGWTYAYLRSREARAMMTAAKYGHIIKHLEPGHLSELPTPRPRDALAEEFSSKAARVLADRGKGIQRLIEAELLLQDIVGLPPEIDSGESGFVVGVAALSAGRRRLDGVFHNPLGSALHMHFRERGLSTASLHEADFDVWLPTRFRRIPATDGVKLVGSSDLFEINPDLTKTIADSDFGDRANGRVMPGWLLLARSGQTYGLNGTLAIANEFHAGKVISDHVIRIAPRPGCTTRVGYVYSVLSHPVLGRPIVKSLAYGSSIPEIDVGDIASMQFVRLDKVMEERIADLAEDGAKLLAAADILENDMADEVDQLIESLLAGDSTAFVST